MSELSEEEMLNIYGFLKKHADKLPSGPPCLSPEDKRPAVQDKHKIEELMHYIEGRLRAISWEKYQRHQGLLPSAEEESKEAEAKET